MKIMLKNKEEEKRKRKLLFFAFLDVGFLYVDENDLGGPSTSLNMISVHKVKKKLGASFT